MKICIKRDLSVTLDEEKECVKVVEAKEEEGEKLKVEGIEYMKGD
ncbi:hypothetical protein [Acidianus sp. HS-5]|nr:hypothetical protein [Acidianus sp. HS-5]BDC17510.1 hypothetical protein HS5_04000 [Acidianus sp. HS-5]